MLKRSRMKCSKQEQGKAGPPGKSDVVWRFIQGTAKTRIQLRGITSNITRNWKTGFSTTGKYNTTYSVEFSMSWMKLNFSQQQQQLFSMLPTRDFTADNSVIEKAVQNKCYCSPDEDWRLNLLPEMRRRMKGRAKQGVVVDKDCENLKEPETLPLSSLHKNLHAVLFGSLVVKLGSTEWMNG